MGIKVKWVRLQSENHIVFCFVFVLNYKIALETSGQQVFP